MLLYEFYLVFYFFRFSKNIFNYFSFYYEKRKFLPFHPKIHTSNEFFVNLDLILDELKIFIPSNSSVNYNFINLLFEVSNVYLLTVVNDEFNFRGSISVSFFSVVASVFFSSFILLLSLDFVFFLFF